MLRDDGTFFVTNLYQMVLYGGIYHDFQIHIQTFFPHHILEVILGETMESSPSSSNGAIIKAVNEPMLLRIAKLAMVIYGLPRCQH